MKRYKRFKSQLQRLFCAAYHPHTAGDQTVLVCSIFPLLRPVQVPWFIIVRSNIRRSKAIPPPNSSNFSMRSVTLGGEKISIMGSLIPSMAFHLVIEYFPSYSVLASISPVNFTSFPLKSVYLALSFRLLKFCGCIISVMYIGIIDIGLPVSRTALTLTSFSFIFSLMQLLFATAF